MTTATATPTLASITFDCVDALVAARFWSQVLHRPLPSDATVDYVQLAGDPAWSFNAVPEPKTAKNRVHFDFDVDDVEVEVDRVSSTSALLASASSTSRATTGSPSPTPKATSST